MRKLERRAAANFYTGRYTLGNGCFRCADGRGAALAVIVVLKVDHSDKPCADFSVGLRALEVNKTVFVLGKAIFGKHTLHFRMYSANSLLNVAFFKINFGQDKFQRGIRFAYRAFYAFPVVGLPRILVTGYDRPLFHIGVLRQENIRRFE